MRRIVLIDGENLVYGLRALLGTGASKAPRSAIDNFNFRALIEEVLADEPPREILWFGARLRQYTHTPSIEAKSNQAIYAQAKFMNQIQGQRITFIKTGYLRARETDACENCQHTTWKLAEKGVDVGLAVRMVQEADEETELVVISADTDLLPAFIASSKLGAKIMHIGYEVGPSFGLTKKSHSTRTITAPLAQKYKAQVLPLED
jgi:hypothetical protein